MCQCSNSEETVMEKQTLACIKGIFLKNPAKSNWLYTNLTGGFTLEIHFWAVLPQLKQLLQHSAKWHMKDRGGTLAKDRTSWTSCAAMHLAVNVNVASDHVALVCMKYHFTDLEKQDILGHPLCNANSHLMSALRMYSMCEEGQPIRTAPRWWRLKERVTWGQAAQGPEGLQRTSWLQCDVVMPFIRQLTVERWQEITVGAVTPGPLSLFTFPFVKFRFSANQAVEYLENLKLEATGFAVFYLCFNPVALFDLLFDK